jgi:hypothetical protein
VNPTSLKWAAIVPIAAVVMLVIVILSNVLTAGPSTTTKVSPKLQKISGLSPAATDPFAKLVVAGEPPEDILNAIVVPEGATLVATPHTGGTATSFDAKIVYTSPASSQALYSFFYEQMKGRGWRIFSTGAPVREKGVEILSQRGASDSWYWEQGVVINPTAFAPDGSQSTTFTLRLYQASSSA